MESSEDTILQFENINPIGMNYDGMLSDDEDDDGISCFTSDDLLVSARQDMISNSLLETGTLNGMAAAAALATARRRNKHFKFEIDPVVRRRHQTRLMRKLKEILNELCSRCGQQAVVVSVSPKNKDPSFRVSGSHPLDQAVRACQNSIIREFKKDLQSKVQNKSDSNQQNKFELPNLIVDGIPTSIDKMNQAQLRMFIPEMLKYATGRGKPGWGKETCKPIWWPGDVPWANVRRDVRTENVKNKITWSTALRQIVKNCYQFHNREDLLHGISPPPYDQQQVQEPHMGTCHRLKLPQSATARNPQQQNAIQSPTFVHTVHNADGSVALVQVDSGQMIATISSDSVGNAMATLSGNPPAGNHDDSNEVNLSVIENGDGETWELTSTNLPHNHTPHHHHHQVNHVQVASTNFDHVINGQLISSENLDISNNEDSRGTNDEMMSFLHKIQTSIKQPTSSSSSSLNASPQPQQTQTTNRSNNSNENNPTNAPPPSNNNNKNNRYRQVVNKRSVRARTRHDISSDDDDDVISSLHHYDVSDDDMAAQQPSQEGGRGTGQQQDDVIFRGRSRAGNYRSLSPSDGNAGSRQIDYHVTIEHDAELIDSDAEELMDDNCCPIDDEPSTT